MGVRPGSGVKVVNLVTICAFAMTFPLVGERRRVSVRFVTSTLVAAKHFVACPPKGGIDRRVRTNDDKSSPDGLKCKQGRTNGHLGNSVVDLPTTGVAYEQRRASGHPSAILQRRVAPNRGTDMAGEQIQAGLRFALIDDQPPILKSVVDTLADAFSVIEFAEARHVDQITSMNVDFDVVILDIELRDGSNATDNVAAMVERGWPTLLYTQETNSGVVGRCFRAGAVGIVGKGEELSTLVEAIGIVLSGQPYLSGDWASALDADAAQIPDLAPREAEALRLYAAGLPMKSVARRMGISPDTVKEYLMRVRHRYELVGRPAPTKTDLYRRAIEDGLLQVPQHESLGSTPRVGGYDPTPR